MEKLPRTFKLVLSGTWIGIKEMVRNPGKVTLAVLMLGLAFRNPHPYLDTHRLWIASAYADLMTEY